MTKGNKKVRFNFVDLFVIFVVIFAIILGGTMLFGNEAGSEKNATITFTVEARGVDTDILSYVKAGQTAYDSVTKNKIGKIVAVNSQDAVKLVENHQEQTIVETNIPDKLDLRIDIEADAKMEYPNIIVDEISLKIGKEVYCIVGDASLVGTVVSLDFDKTLLTKQEAETK